MSDLHAAPATEAWLIRMSDGTRFIHGHNAIGDYRAIDPDATVTELVPRAALSAPAPGYVLVPVEPTPEMCQKGQWKAQEWPTFPLRIVPIWKAMCAAVPSAKESQT